MGKAGLTEMNVAIDHTGQKVQTAAIDGLARRGSRQVADRGKPAGADAEIARALAVVIDDGAAFEDQVVGVSHARHRA